MALPPQFLEELRDRVPLSDVVGKRIRLVRAGREFKAPCPFHNEKTPSFYVNDQKGFFHCFGCGAHGDVLGFVMRHDNLSFMEAVEQLAGMAGMPVPKATPEAREKAERQKTLYDLLERTTRHYEQQLYAPAGRFALDYLRRRGLDDGAIARFRLGFAPPDGGLLRQELVKAGYGEADLVEAGVFRRPDDGRAPYAFFRNRVMFPVSDRRGRVVAYGGRILEGEGPKYVNTGDTPLFHKGQLLYGLSRARQAAGDGHAVIVTEGYMDVITCVLAGFEGAVAPLGTALTEAQVLELWKLAPEGRRRPILCFDGDNAGRRAASRAVERILPLLLPDHTACVAFLPEKEDPDSLIRTGGPAAFQAVLDRALPLPEVLWQMEKAGRDLAQADSRAGLEAALMARCAQINDATVRRAYERDMRDRLFQAGRDLGRKAAKAGWSPRRFPPGGLPVSRLWDPKYRSGIVWTEPTRREGHLLAIIINHPQLFDDVGEQLGDVVFSADPLERLRQEVVAALTAESSLDAGSIRRHLSSRGYAETLDSLLSADAPNYAQPGASTDVAIRGWQEVWLNSQELVLQAELKRAERQFAADPNEANWARFMGLKEEALQRRGHSLGLSDPDE